MSDTGGQITALAAGGFGATLGLAVGDRLLAINGHRLRDVIDFQFYGAEEEVEVTVQRGDRELNFSAARRYHQPWGVDLAEPLFDGVRTCGNRCLFCFVSGLPRGLRRSLYVRDDDYRLSFLYGNFVTLTNLRADDWQRLAEQRLSPLYVSVQATELDLRRRLLGGRPIPDVREQIHRLGQLGIQVHAQVVICPGLNDGAALERTLSDLWDLRDTVDSVALVPVGLTRHHPAAIRPLSSEQAGAILALADRWRRLASGELGRRFVYPSDELYLLARRPVPGAAAYDGYPQLANGVGLLRRFLDGWARTRRRLARVGARAPAVQSATLVSGYAFAPFLEEVARELSLWLGNDCRAVGVANGFFGERVTVAGLLTGRDVVEQLSGQGLGQLVVLPRSMFDASGERTLDDWTPGRLAEALQRPVAMAASASELLHALTSPVTQASRPVLPSL